MKFERLVDLYLESEMFMRLDPKSKSMYTNYANKLRALGKGLMVHDTDMPDRVAGARSRSLTSIWWDRIDGYEAEGKTITNSTRNTLHTYLKVIYRFAVTKGLCNEGELPTRFDGWAHKRPTYVPFKIEEIRTIERMVANGEYPDDVASYMMFVVTMFYMGLRPMDMYKHERTWFMEKGKAKYLEVWGNKGKDKRENDGKGEFSHLVKLEEHDLEIMKYWEKQPVWIGAEKYTFRTATGKQFAQSGWMAYKIRLGCTLAGIEPRALYESRRGIVTELKKAGMSFPDIKERVGHIKEETTQVYAHLTPVEKADGYKAPWAELKRA